MQAGNFARTRSCGCLKVEMLKAKATHGMSDSPEYRARAELIARCSNPSQKAFSLYGGRGITVCPEWLASFAAFYADMGPRPTSAHSIDRIDNDGDYTPHNCRWATRKTQRINQRRTQLITVGGVTATLKDHARRVGLTYSAVHQRVNTLGWSVERALSTPHIVRKRSTSH